MAIGVFATKEVLLGGKWIMGGDFNDTRNHDEKLGGRRRLENSFASFRNFIPGMEMGELKFIGDMYTWANNRAHESFIQ